LSLFPYCLTTLALSISTIASAQQLSSPSAPAATGSDASAGASATDSGSSSSSRSGLSIVPTFRLTETVTDNVKLVKSSDARSDFITQVSPGLSLNSKSGAVQGTLQAAYNGSFYGEDQSRNQGFLTMRGSGRVEAWQQHGFVDLNASVTRETISAFTPKPGDSVTGTNNLSEVRNFMVAPYWVERFGDSGSAELRYLFSETDASQGAFKQSKRNVVSFNAGDPAAFGNVGWSVTGSDSVMSTVGRRDLKQQSLRFTGFVRPVSQFQLRFITGMEGNNIRSVDTQRSSIYGMGADWTVSPATKLTALWEDRYFGPAFQLSADHRSALYALNLRYSKDVTTTSQALAAISEVGTYDLLMSMTQSSHPDAVERDAYVRQYITDHGLPDTVGISQAVLSNGIFLDRRLRLGLSLMGARNTLVFSAFHSERSRQSEQSFSAFGGDFESASRIREVSGSAILSHKLTPVTSANVSLTVSSSHRDTSDATLAPGSRMRRVSTGLVTKLSRGANGMLTLRNIKGDGASTYSENAAIASLFFTF
jgi:uncharacterized protein (PEP-CTERM system associated)